MKRLRNVVFLLLAFALVAAACSSADDGGDTTETTAPTTTAAPETTTTQAPDTGGGDTTTTTEGEVDLTGRSVSVFGSESSDVEAGSMQDALTVFAAETGLRITFTGARDFSDQINAQAAGGNPPDIAIFPQPGKLADFARQGFILPVTDEVNTRIVAEWPEAVAALGNVDGVQYGAPNKSDIKSLVWYDRPSFEAAGYTVPTTLDELWALTAQIRADGGTPWCIGIESGPATGWVFTDWVEDMMLRVEGADVYDQWVAGEVTFSDDRVKSIWNTILDEWNIPGNVFAAGGSIAATAFGDNAQPLVDGDCVLHRQASFFASFFPAGTVTGPEGIDVFFFPGETADDKPVLGGGTYAAAFKDAPEVWAVIDFLASAEYAEIRQVAQTARQDGALSGFLSANTQQDLSVYQPLEQTFISLLANASLFRFDGSDLMPAAVGAGTFWTEGTSAVNGDKSVDDATAAIDASWP